MKQTIILTSAAVVVLVGSGGLALNHYHQYKTKQNHQAQVVASVAAQKQASAINSVKQSDAAEYQALLGQCQKGVVAYNALPSVVKTKVPAPVCAVH